MAKVERTIEEFEVSSADGQRVRVRKSLIVHWLRNSADPDQLVVRQNRAVYSGLARGGLERPRRTARRRSVPYRGKGVR